MNNSIFIDFCVLYSEIHRRFYDMDVDSYQAAMSELVKMADPFGYTINDLAMACTYAG